MSERPKGTPVWHKIFGVVETVALAACTTGERIGFVAPPPEGTATNLAETVPTLSDGNYDFWSIAKIDLAVDPETGKRIWVNRLKPGEKGFVEELGQLGGPPYKVDGYDYVKETSYGDTGVTIFEYAPAAEVQDTSRK